MDQGTKVMKGYFQSSSLTIKGFNVISRTLVAGMGSYSAEIQPVYYTSPADWAAFYFSKTEPDVSSSPYFYIRKP